MAKLARPLLKIAITTGDTNGIGLEVTFKALLRLGPQKNIQYIVFRSSHTPSPLKKMERLLAQKFQPHSLRYEIRKTSPAHWVEEAGRLCLTQNIQALATAPLSKETIQNAGFAAIGHTEILKKLSGAKSVHMGFLGKKFNVLLATGHVAIKNIGQALTEESLWDALTAANRLRQVLPALAAKRPLALVGLNPHAGEKGLIGLEESTFYAKVISRAAQNSIPVIGPLVPDAAFFKENWSKYSIFVCSYHDQGLIPFKMIHGQDDGAHVSLGLPFVRTSVDHGTAQDIFGMNIANPNSMIEAILWAQKLARKALNGI